MSTLHQNHKDLFLLMIYILMASLMVLSLLLASCAPAVTEEEAAPSEEEEVAPTPQAPGGTIVVTSTADSGSGSLRQALRDAQSDDTITFDPAVFPPGAPATIYPSSELPHITKDNLTIDASNAGVILDGSNISEQFVPALEIHSDGNTIQGLQIVDFSPGAGIVLAWSAKNNTIGGDRSTGSGPVGQGNLVAYGDIGIGLWDYGTSFNTITGNLIGTDPTGSKDWGNDGSGICIDDFAIGNTVGPDNVIAYNNGHGIEIRGSNSLCNTITQNSIHGNEGEGIYLWEGGNTELNAPLIFNFDLAAGTVVGTACADCTVEVFSDNSNQGEAYEGQTTADGTGAFSFNKGASFTGPHLTATATDADGNTSGFSMPASGTGSSFTLQDGNSLPKIQIQTKRSKELVDNHIGEQVELPDIKTGLDRLCGIGYKWLRIEIDKYGKWWDEDWSDAGDYIDPLDDQAITNLTENGISVIACLGAHADLIGKHDDFGRFKTQGEIEQYLEYLRFIIRHFKDRIQYYEIWNEPNVWLPDWYIDLSDYINLVRRSVAIIRQECPEARIVVGGTSELRDSGSHDYLLEVLNSDIMPSVDAVSWHPMYGASPQHRNYEDYYYDYPSIVQEIKAVASAHGFEGEFIADELNWRTQSDPDNPEEPVFSESTAAKYYARSIVSHLGMGIIANRINWGSEYIDRVIQNLCTVMAGAQPAILPVEMETKAENVKSYAFSLSNGDRMLALWTDGVALDDNPGMEATLTFPDFSARKVVGIDVLNGFEQQLVTESEDGNMIIRNLLIKDYPIILHLSP